MRFCSEDIKMLEEKRFVREVCNCPLLLIGVFVALFSVFLSSCAFYKTASKPDTVTSISVSEKLLMDECVDLSSVLIETNSELWQVKEFQGEQVIQIVNNTDQDGIRGKAALIGGVRRNYSMEAELKFLGHHFKFEEAGWFGLVIRAQDTENYELVWFMPNSKSETAAYLAVAHGVVPWWTEAYETQKKVRPYIPDDTWFRVRVDVIDDEMTLYVEDKPVFTKKLTFYLSKGRPGLYVGTATDAVFRRIVISDLP